MRSRLPAARVAPLIALLTLLPSDGAAQAGGAGGQNDDVASGLFTDLGYRSVGPSRGGRVTAVAGDETRPGFFYMGATGGGVWKTTDYGQTWRPISDGYFETGSIGAIRVAPSNPNVVYVGTGSDGIRSNVIIGKGVYRSNDEGTTWRHIGLRDVGQIGAVEIDPNDADVAYVAALGNPFKPTPDRGVYRTRNGGRNWEKVLFVSDSTGAVDLEIAPDNPDVLFAVMWRAERKPWTIISGAMEGGVYKSIDGGDSWNQLTVGLPQGLRGKGDLAISPANPRRIYVLIEAPEPDDGLYRSDDEGRTWRQVSSMNGILNRPFYYTNVDVDPNDEDVVYVNNERFYRSTDGGRTWERRSTPHGDNHDMWIDPSDSDVFIQSNDGGANVTRDGGETWSTQYNQPTAELYQVDLDDRFPYWLYAGQQDNSTITVPSRQPYSVPGDRTSYWRSIGGCETGPAIPKPGNPDIVYANCKGRFGRYNMKTGQERQYYVGAWDLYGRNPADLPFRFQRVSPIHVSPNDPDVVYHASQYVHRTTDDGIHWETISPDLTAFDPATQMASGSPITRDITGEEHYSVIYEVQESPHEPGVIWTGANDGPVHVTRDGGETWTDVTPPMPGFGRVQTIEVSPHNPAKAYVSAFRYLLGDFQPYGFRTEDYGQSWTRITTGENGIPDDHPVHVIREDPDREGLLYAGTDFGMFISFDDGGHWQSFQQNLPVTPITDLKVYRQDLVLSTMGRGFWIMDDLTPLHQWTDEVASADVHLFEARPAYRQQSGGRGGGSQAPDPADPVYPPSGVMLNYVLGEDLSTDLTLEITDAGGDLIRAFSSEGGGGAVAATQFMRAPVLIRSGTRPLPTSAGAHRFVWDMKHAGPWDSDASESGTDGPLVVPGTYTATLSAGAWTASTSFEVRIDPRVADDGVTQAQLEAQEALALQVRDQLSQTRMVAARVGLERRSQNEGSNVDQMLAEIEKALVTDTENGIRYAERMMLRQVEYLYNMLNRADQEPGRDAFVRYEELETELQTHIRNLERILRTVTDEGAGGD